MNTLLTGAADKLALLQHLIQHDFPSGVTVIDPTGTLAETIADSVPPEFAERVFYFDPSETSYIASFNVFENVLDGPKLVQDLCAFFDALFPAGPETLTRQTSNFVLANILTILLDSPQITFLSILEFLKDIPLRETYLKRCKNKIALRNWEAIEGWDKGQRNAAFSHVQIKIGTLLLSPTLYRTLQEPSTYYLTKTPIFIANLSRAKLGDGVSKLLGTLLISRAKTPVYINDFAFFASDYLGSLFSQGGYTVAIQSLSQLSKPIQQTVLAFEKKYVFKSTMEDAERLTPYIDAVDNPQKLVDLSPEEFLPKAQLEPSLSGRFKAVRKRSRACHTRRVE